MRASSAIAYETVTAAGGGLPLLAPMSEVAGRMAVQVGAKCLEKEAGGIGKLLGGVPGVAPAKVVILGGGTAGANAALIALGMQADVTILDKSVNRLRWLADRFGSGLRVVMANPQTIHEYVVDADLVIGAVLVPGAAAPKLVSREMVREMRDGSVRGRRRDRPGRLFRNEPADDPLGADLYRRRRRALLRHEHAGRGRAHVGAGAQQRDAPLRQGVGRQRSGGALNDDPHLAAGLNVHRGAITHAAVAEALGYPFKRLSVAA